MLFPNTASNGDMITCASNNEVYLAIDGGVPGFDANKHMAVTHVTAGCSATRGVALRDISDTGAPTLLTTVKLVQRWFIPEGCTRYKHVTNDI
jgi:hypothetical protein